MEARVIGTVVLDIVISGQGNVEYTHIISGPKMLLQPVLDAVRRYKYLPYLLNGKPVEVETTVSVTCQNY
jgi:protein TonB